MRRARLLVPVAALLLGLTGCGIPVDAEPRPVRPPPGPYQALASQSPSAPDNGTVAVKLFFAKGDTIVGVERRTDRARTPEELIRDLIAGPNDVETNAGLTSALPGTAVIDAVRMTNGIAVVNITEGLEGIRNDEVLAFAQIVCTLDARPDVKGVIFRHGPVAIDVPAGDGSLTRAPLTTADYSEVFAR